MKVAKTLRLLVLLAIAFGGGALASRQWLPIAATPADAPKARYQCSMHPQIVSDHPGLCPICQMELQRVDESEPTPPARSSKVLFYRHPMRADVTSPVPAKDEMGMDYIPVREEDLGVDAGASIAGHAPFTLSTARQQLIGVTRARVERRPLDIEIRASGKVAYDPMLYQAITDYREALKSRAALKQSNLAEASAGARTIATSAALRLRQMGISEQQLREIAEGGSPPTNLLLPGKSVWIYAQVYEHEMDLVHPGQAVEVTTLALPGRKFTAKLVAIDPMLNPTTRSVRVRALLQTPDVTLRPETFVDVRIEVPLGEKVAVPQNAVLDTGEHQIVFVVQGDGHFQPRDIEVGRAAQGYYEVLAGLEPGEEIVTSANFLIDSESRFRAALAAFSARSAVEKQP